MKLSTFSIIAFDKQSGCLGGAAASFYPALGAFFPHIRSRTAIVASQGWVNPWLGPQIGDLMAAGAPPAKALAEALAQDAEAQRRQITIVDYQGNSAAHSGQENDAYCAHICGPGYVVAGNLLPHPQVLEQMEAAYLQPGTFSERLLAALCAADAAGGDKRGKKAAVLRVENVPGFPFIDFRVDDSITAVNDLAQIFQRNHLQLENTYHGWVKRISDNYQTVKRS